MGKKKQHKNQSNGRSYMERLFEFTEKVARQALPEGEIFSSVWSTSFGPERIYRNIVQCMSGNRFYIYFTYKEFQRGRLDCAEWNHDFR